MPTVDETKNIGLRGITVADTQVSMVDGVEGKLFYRGFAIQDLAEQATFEEVIYLLLKGQAPDYDELAEVTRALQESRDLPEEIKNMLLARPKTAAPMDVMQGAVTALADLDPGLTSTNTRRQRARFTRQESNSCRRISARPMGPNPQPRRSKTNGSNADFTCRPYL